MHKSHVGSLSKLTIISICLFSAASSTSTPDASVKIETLPKHQLDKHTDAKSPITDNSKSSTKQRSEQVKNLEAQVNEIAHKVTQLNRALGTYATNNNDYFNYESCKKEVKRHQLLFRGAVFLCEVIDRGTKTDSKNNQTSDMMLGILSKEIVHDILDIGADCLLISAPRINGVSLGTTRHLSEVLGGTVIETMENKKLDWPNVVKEIVLPRIAGEIIVEAAFQVGKKTGVNSTIETGYHKLASWPTVKALVDTTTPLAVGVMRFFLVSRIKDALDRVSSDD